MDRIEWAVLLLIPKSEAISVTPLSGDSLVNPSRTASAFAMVYYRFTSGGTQYFYEVTSRARLTYTTVEYDRANSVGTITGHYFVVEDTDGYFSVTHEDVDIINPATSATTAITSVDDDKSFLIASYKNYYGSRSAQYSTVSVWMTGPTQLRSEQFLNSGYPADSYIRAQVVTFLKGGAVQRAQQAWTNSDTFNEDTLSPTVDLDYTIANIPITQSTQKNNTTGDSNTYTAWFDAEITDSSTIRIDRQGAVTGSEGTVAWEAITFPSTLHYFDGYVQEFGVGVDRTVRVHRRDTGEAVGETTSSGVDGYFYLETSYSGTQYLLCLDDLAGESFNAIVYDLMVPTVSG